MKRSRRISAARSRAHTMAQDEAVHAAAYYRQSPFWQMIAAIADAEDKAAANASDNQPAPAVDGGK